MHSNNVSDTTNLNLYIQFEDYLEGNIMFL